MLFTMIILSWLFNPEIKKTEKDPTFQVYNTFNTDSFR
jgi:hypothetical protein